MLLGLSHTERPDATCPYHGFHALNLNPKTSVRITSVACWKSRAPRHLGRRRVALVLHRRGRAIECV
jgi:hypothetical protein